MYSSRGAYGASPPPELSNNPFIDHPANALTRFPDINGTDEPTGSSQFTSWMGRGNSSMNTSPTGYVGAVQPSGFGGGFPSSQQSGYPGSPVGGYPQQGGFNTGFNAPTPPQPTGAPFQPTSSFGQQLAGQVNSAYGAQSVPQHQQQQQFAGYPTSPQYASPYGYSQAQVQAQPQQNRYLPEFDPYASQASSQGPAPPGPSQGASPYQSPHPREFVRSHKQEPESWDSYAWKQARLDTMI